MTVPVVSVADNSNPPYTKENVGSLTDAPPADRHAAEHAGDKRVATALVYLHATDFLPQARLSSLVETFVATRQPPTGLFAEQARLVREANRGSWEDACRRALARGTGLFDDHPCLAERLKAQGVGQLP